MIAPAAAAQAQVCMYQGCSTTRAGAGAGADTGLAATVAAAAGAGVAIAVLAVASEAEPGGASAVPAVATDTGVATPEEAEAARPSLASALEPALATAGSIAAGSATVPAAAGAVTGAAAPLRAAASLACNSAISLSFNDSRCSFLALMSARSFSRAFRSPLCCCRLAKLSRERSNSSRKLAEDWSVLPDGCPPPVVPACGGTSASRSSLPVAPVVGEPEEEARVAASATIAGLTGVPARQSLFCRLTSAAAAARVMACASDALGTRNTTPLLSALMLSR